MITTTQNRTKIGKVMAVGLLVATLLAMVLASTRADAAVSAGSALAWGDNFFGQLGNDTHGEGTNTNIPVAVRNISGVKSVKAGCAHGLALKENGLVRAWGDNSSGQLGNANTGTDTDVPVAINIENVKAIAAGCSHSLALKENGTVWAWGYNYYGQLGNDTSGAGTDKNLPVRVANIGTGAKAIAAGDNFSLALMKDGTVRSWGRNGDGELGNGAVELSDTPGPVSNLSNVKAIATDSYARHALALKTDGTVRSWGRNVSGQLGNGASLPAIEKRTPVRVANLTGVQAIAAGGDHSLALMESGRIKSWGNNNQGELGNGDHGDSADRSTPGSVIGLENVRSISGGGYHSLAVLESGRARAWGDNSSGQLGNGNTGTDTDVPVAVKDLSNVTTLSGVRSVDGGGGFTLAATQ
jgi:alpha-tubulin suppressor-like RCC1 family protein